MLNKKVKRILYLILCLVLLFPLSTKAQISGGVDIGAQVYGCILKVKVHPERRMPIENNWGTAHIIEIRSSFSNSLVASFTTTSNKAGESTVDLCAKGIYLSAGKYDFYVRGSSHLRKKYREIDSFYYYQTSINLVPLGKDLYAGETSAVFDNYINSLDISTQMKNFYSQNTKDDLNQDGRVNSLDIGNTIKNFYLKGD